MAKDKSTNWKTERRKRAWALYQAGWMQKDIAEALGVTKGAVSQWIKRGREGGEAALREQPKSGAPSRLSPGDRERLPELLQRGAESFGFRGELWTCFRVGKVIQHEFGVKSHPAHVSRILKELGWTPQNQSDAPGNARKQKSSVGRKNAGRRRKKRPPKKDAASSS